MSASAIRVHCSKCGDPTPHAYLPAPAECSTDTGSGQKQRLICSRCETSWEAAIVPWEQIKQLRAAAASLDEARRQIALLRLIMSKDQIARAEKVQGDTIKLHRAA